MVIVKIFGGLGNQMFQYAFFIGLKNKGFEAYTDDTWVKSNQGILDFNSIYDVFEIHEMSASIKDIKRLGDTQVDTLSRIRRRVFGVKNSHFEERIEDWGHIIPDVFARNEVYYSGYWQSEDYFLDSVEKVRDTYSDIRRDYSDRFNAYLDLIKSVQHAVSLHVRLGDYVEMSETYGGICTDDYYQRAISYIKSMRKVFKLFVFSNDPDGAKKLPCLEGIDHIVFDKSKPENDWEDMMLMKECDDNIIANSSFSWWGAWLNSHPDKIVVAPSKWVNTAEMMDIVPKTWVRI